MNFARACGLIRLALREDIGRRDITSELFIPKDTRSKALIIAKEPAVICGLPLAKKIFSSIDKGIKIKLSAREGQKVAKGKVIMAVSGRARSILLGERVALNFLSFLSGIATKTSRYISRVKPYRIKIMDTRKTLPGLRFLQRYAVRIGGGYNHRMCLDGMVLVKDNHLKVIGDRFWVSGHRRTKDKVKIEIEVKTLKEFEAALNLKPDIIMLDNMSIADMRKAVSLNRAPQTAHRKPRLEASGGITLKNIRKVASTGVDMISIGDLTHSVDYVDLSLEIAA